MLPFGSHRYIPDEAQQFAADRRYDLVLILSPGS